MRSEGWLLLGAGLLLILSTSKKKGLQSGDIYTPDETLPQDQFDCTTVALTEDGDYVAIDADPDEPNVYGFPEAGDVSVAATTFNAILSGDYCGYYSGAPLGATPHPAWAEIGIPQPTIRHIAAEIHRARTFSDLQSWVDAEPDLLFVTEHFNIELPAQS